MRAAPTQASATPSSTRPAFPALSENRPEADRLGALWSTVPDGQGSLMVAIVSLMFEIRFLAARLGADPALVARTSVADANLPPGIGPAHTTLDSSELQARFGILVPEPWPVLDAVLDDMER